MIKTVTQTIHKYIFFFFLMVIGISQYVKEACSQTVVAGKGKESEGYRICGYKVTHGITWYTIPLVMSEKLRLTEGIWLAQGYLGLEPRFSKPCIVPFCYCCCAVIGLAQWLKICLLAFVKVKSPVLILLIIWVGAHKSIKWKWDISL